MDMIQASKLQLRIMLYKLTDYKWVAINKSKQCSRVATRYDKLAANYFAFIQRASIRL